MLADMSGIADIYDAVINPGKLELLSTWLRDQDWFTGEADELTQVTSYRFVDPEGDVGMECFILRSGDRVFHVPVTYRGAPLADGDGALIGTMEHSVLSTRFVYDAPRDPVYRSELRRVIVERDSAADHRSMEEDRVSPAPMYVRGGGSPQGVGEEVVVARDLTDAAAGDNPVAEAGTLVGSWEDDGTSRSALLARLR